MAEYYISSTQAKYQLYFTNRNTEDSKDENETSSASNFEITTAIDLNPLIFLKSSHAQLALSHLSIDGLCCCFTKTESVTVSTKTGIVQHSPNVVFNEVRLQNENEKVLKLHFNDTIATDINQPITTMNTLVQSQINLFLAYRFSLTYFDKRVFKSDLFSDVHPDDPIQLTPQEINLLMRYIDFTFVIRRVYHNTLDSMTNQGQTHCPAITPSNIRPLLTANLENDILNTSDNLISITERTATENTHFTHTLTVEDFYSVDCSKPNHKLAALETKIKTEFHTYIENLAIDINNLSKDDKDFLILLQSANIHHINQGKKMQDILILEKKKLSKDFSNDLFHSEFLSFQFHESTSKCVFQINNSLFLPNDQVNLITPIVNVLTDLLIIVQTRPIAIHRVRLANKTNQRTDGQTDRPTNRQTNKEAYRVACT